MTSAEQANDESETIKTLLLARSTYGRMLAYLAAQWRDIARAEDALADALVRALETWPQSGVPEEPEAWLLQVARRKLLDSSRRESFHVAFGEAHAHLALNPDFDTESIPDKRLTLMLLCAHPAIDPAIRPALMLQTVLGIDAETIASAMLISPSALEKRLTRAKLKIRDAGIKFELPEKRHLSQRLQAVLDAIYGAYSLGADLTMTADDESDDLRQEALFLAQLIATLAPDEPEALGLCAIFQFCEARRAAQLDGNGDFVPLLLQRSRDWNSTRIHFGNQLLGRATHLSLPGPFQTEAAIHAAHCSRLHTGFVPWKEIYVLYVALQAQSFTIASCIGLAVAVTYAHNSPAEGLAMLAALPDAPTRNYQPWWLARAHIAELSGSFDLALQYIDRALALSVKPIARRFLLRERYRIEHVLVTANALPCL